MNDTSKKMYNQDPIDSRIEGYKTHSKEALKESLDNKLFFLQETAKYLILLEKFFQDAEDIDKTLERINNDLNTFLSKERESIQEWRMDLHLDRAVIMHTLDLNEIYQEAKKDE